MINVNQRFLTVLLCTLLIFITISCSDDSPTGLDEEPPQVPEAIPVEVDNSIFQNNNPSGVEFQAFNDAGSLAQAASSNLFGSTSLGQGLLSLARSEQATLVDGQWVWEFSFSTGGETLTIKTTAEEVAEGVEWATFISGLFGSDETLNEFPYLSGFVSNDGSSGNWQYQIPGQQENGSVNYGWEIESETQFNFSTIIQATNEDRELRIDFERDGVNNFLELSGFSSAQNVTVFWDASTGIGYIDRPGEERRCWDETFRETACS